MADLGKIRRRIAFINITPAQDANGVWDNPTGTTLATVWAYRTKNNSSRRYNQFSQGYDNSYRYEIWYSSGFTPNANMIIRDNSQDYTITSIELVDDKKRKYLITAELKASG